MTPEEEARLTKLAQLLEGVTCAFMIMLSSKRGLTFAYTDILLESFPFDMFELHTSRNDETHTTTFSLVDLTERAH